MPIMIMPYKRGSKGAAALSNALGLRQVRLANSTLKGSAEVTLINWGSPSFHNNPEFAKCTIINRPELVKLFSDKLEFFRTTDPELCVPWTTDEEQVKTWCGEGKSVFARRVLNGHSGAGIVELNQDNMAEWVKAPLYTLYIPKESEYRLHFMDHRVIDLQKKSLPKEKAANKEADAWKVRNLANGFVFARHFGEAPAAVTELMNKFLETCQLDFGAADVIYNKKRNQAYLLEVNTAPGIMGSTVDAYKQAFTERLGL